MLRCFARRSKRPCLLNSARAMNSAPGVAQPAHQAAFSAEDAAKTPVENIRNIGISAHIDSGKTTVSERILFYGGRIDSIHDVKGKDGVGAKMDSMELEKQRGITIKSAATSMVWKGNQLNLIDTPGHIDFTVEVERALRVLDGAVLVLCASGGVQTQTYTVYRQMKRYRVPFISFVNKMDRAGADAHRTLHQMRNSMGLNAAFIYTPIGAVRTFSGLLDVLGERTVYFEGPNGEQVEYRDIPVSMEEELISRRNDLVECLSNVDEEIGERYLMEEDISVSDIKKAIKRTVLTQSFTPVICGSALKNKGVQPLLDSVLQYLPNPSEVQNLAIRASDQTKVPMSSDRSEEHPAVGLAFKLEENRFGQLTYVRMYQGCFKRGMAMINTRTKEKMRVPRLVQMHSNETENVAAAYAGDIVAMIGVTCASGDTFIDSKTPEKQLISMESMFIPDPVISMSIKNMRPKDEDAFSKAMNRFTREDPTFVCTFNPETKEMLISGMGELQLEIYAERARREYGCEVQLGNPTVNYRESLTGAPIDWAVTYKRQSGGKGQFGAAYGVLETLEDSSLECEFESRVTGGDIPSSYIKSCKKGFQAAVKEGALSGHKITGLRMILEGGATHPVDSSDFAFQNVTFYAIKEHFIKQAQTQEPWMNVEVSGPSDASGSIIESITKRGGNLKGMDIQEGLCTIDAAVPLQSMFGYTTDLRKMTSGLGTYQMEFREYLPVEEDQQEKLVAAYRETKQYKNTGSSEFGT